MAAETLTFGVLADSQAQLNDLVSLVEATGHRVAIAKMASVRNLLAELPAVDAWVVRLNLQQDSALAIVEHLESSDCPVIYDDMECYGNLGGHDRAKRFAAKLQLCTGVAKPEEGARAQEVWVLAASTGGPEAVTRFLKALSPELEGVAFIYAQHINAEISQSLQKALLLSTQWSVVTCERSRVLREKSIYVVPPDNQVDIYDSGVIAPNSLAWLGPYRPSADQVMARLARHYGNRAGAIVFSGMGDDGSKSCSYMRRSGGMVWAQSPATCAVDSMPVSAIATGVVSYQGSPENLARQFVYRRLIPPKAINN